MSSIDELLAIEINRIEQKYFIERCANTEKLYNKHLDKTIIPFKEWMEMYGRLSQEEINFIKACYE
jgi:hypothetical protein